MLLKKCYSQSTKTVISFILEYNVVLKLYYYNNLLAHINNKCTHINILIYGYKYYYNNLSLLNILSNSLI